MQFENYCDQERDLLKKLSLPTREVVNYLRVIESSYLPAQDVPYHNHLHAADVTQSVHALLALPALQVCRQILQKEGSNKV